MSFDMDSVLDRVLGKLEEIGKTKTVIGEQFVLGEFTVVPVIRVGLGFGSGGGSGAAEKQGQGSGGGVGGGVGIEPIGFLVARGDQIQMIGVEKGGAFKSFVDKMPDMMDKFTGFKKKKDDE